MGDALNLASLTAVVDRRPWLVCVTKRREDGGFSAPSSDSSISIELEPLDEHDGAELVHLQR
jgi:hypothetical protein